MSGVYIEGIDMPRDCEYLDLVITRDGNVCCYDAEGVSVAKAIPVPDHGDLIDRDVVVARLAEWSKRLIENYGENDEYVNCLSEVLEGLGCDDVVIPAERSEE